MKPFKTTDIEIKNYCQNIFRFELPIYCSVKQITNEIFSLVRLVYYSSVDNSVCKHISAMTLIASVKSVTSECR